ncbi:MAG: hypothetical protein IJI59_03500 [Clostridia bacterium]|nr:hypothetical protein [Clostridia bacterium]
MGLVVDVGKGRVWMVAGLDVGVPVVFAGFLPLVRSAGLAIFGRLKAPSGPHDHVVGQLQRAEITVFVAAADGAAKRILICSAGPGGDVGCAADFNIRPLAA